MDGQFDDAEESASPEKHMPRRRNADSTTAAALTPHSLLADSIDGSVDDDEGQEEEQEEEIDDVDVDVDEQQVEDQFTNNDDDNDTPSTPNKETHTAAETPSSVTISGVGECFHGCVPLGLEEDQYQLSEFHNYIRRNLVELFTSTSGNTADVAKMGTGRLKASRSPLEGQVGIRCRYCSTAGKMTSDANPSSAVTFPCSIKGIYTAVMNMLRSHFTSCSSIPPDVQNQIRAYQKSSNNRGGRREYWIFSAKKLGLQESKFGIYFAKDPTKKMGSAAEDGVDEGEGDKKDIDVGEANDGGKPKPKIGEGIDIFGAATASPKPQTPKKKRRRSSSVASVGLHADEDLGAVNAELVPDTAEPLVFEDEKPLIADFLFLTMQQMQRCTLTNADKVGCYRVRQVGFPGLACRHCIGQAGSGRYFPASEASLSQTTTSQTILNHVKNCRRCPRWIKEELEAMQRATPSKKDKPRHGGRKVFFHRLWCRIQNIPIDGEVGDTPSDKLKTGKAAANELLRELESAYETAYEVRELDAEACYTGRVTLGMPDDKNVLSKQMCYIRNECVELFSASKEHVSKTSGSGKGGTLIVKLNQVGVRCKFCATTRGGGTFQFPETIKGIYDVVHAWQRRHFTSCKKIPTDIVAKLSSLEAKQPAKEFDIDRYWSDCAREQGLVDTVDGVYFERDPLLPTPASFFVGALKDGDDEKNESLIFDEEKEVVTDNTFLLMQQAKVCILNREDQGKGISDRHLGYPGMCCKHCDGRDDNFQGRYFPHTKKIISDTFPNSFYVHILACSHCPNDVKNSLRYLEYRGLHQEEKLGRNWKKKYFAKILWKRLRENNNADLCLVPGKADDYFDGGSSSNESETPPPNNDIIRIAAMWLCTRERKYEQKAGKKKTVKRPKRSED